MRKAACNTLLGAHLRHVHIGPACTSVEMEKTLRSSEMLPTGLLRDHHPQDAGSVGDTCKVVSVGLALGNDHKGLYLGRLWDDY